MLRGDRSFVPLPQGSSGRGRFHRVSCEAMQPEEAGVHSRSLARVLATAGLILCFLAQPNVAARAVPKQLAMPTEECPDCYIASDLAPADVAGKVPAQERVRNFIKSNRVAVFSKTWCPFCAKAKAALTKEGVKFEALELDEMQLSESQRISATLKQLTGIRTVPVVFVDGKCIGGGDDTAALQRSGELRKLLDAWRPV